LANIETISGGKMNYLWRLVPVILASSLVLPACDKKQDDRAPSSERPQSSTFTPSEPGTPMSDSDLEKAIHAKLESDDALKQAKLSVNADVKDNKVTIAGAVASQELRTKAVELAKSAQPGIIIEDEIDVKPSA
jgi:BON domain-containing protein